MIFWDCLQFLCLIIAFAIIGLAGCSVDNTAINRAYMVCEFEGGVERINPMAGVITCNSGMSHAMIKTSDFNAK